MILHTQNLWRRHQEHSKESYSMQTLRFNNLNGSCLMNDDDGSIQKGDRFSCLESQQEIRNVFFCTCFVLCRCRRRLPCAGARFHQVKGIDGNGNQVCAHANWIFSNGTEQHFSILTSVAWIRPQQLDVLTFWLELMPPFKIYEPCRFNGVN